MEFSLRSLQVKGNPHSLLSSSHVPWSIYDRHPQVAPITPTPGIYTLVYSLLFSVGWI